MTALEIRWDAAKERANRRKHGISFQEAATAFADEHALVMPDPDHSKSEERFLLLGLASSLRLLVVAHCFRETGGTIRIISARKATRRERTQYAGRK